MILRYLAARFSARRRATVPLVPLAPGGTLYVIGDIHGRADLLDRLLEAIADDRAASGVPGRLVFLGDYVDRGEQSREVIDRLIGLGQAEPGPAPVFLMGNHEEMMLGFLDRPEAGQRWLRFGGLETLMSYGLGRAAAEVMADGDDADGLAGLAGALAEALGSQRRFLEGLALIHRAGNLLCVHAAADPALPPDEQDLETLLWGHAAFGTRPREDGLWVVHGHTIVSQPAAADGVISIDTGACYTGRLTAARLSDEGWRFLST